MTILDDVAREIRNDRKNRELGEAVSAGLPTTDDCWWVFPPSKGDICAARVAMETLKNLHERKDIMDVCGVYDSEFYEAWPRVVDFILNEKSK